MDKLSLAIKLGARNTGFHSGSYFDYGCTCTLGAAAYALGIADESDITYGLYLHFPVLYQLAPEWMFAELKKRNIPIEIDASLLLAISRFNDHYKHDIRLEIAELLERNGL